MLKVFLVEDEIVVREGIKNNVSWAENDFVFCGEASDGELAYPMIQKIRPDIVITDIRMPFMDGLQLSRLLKKEMPWIKIIILSGYEEFEYAQEAIEIGITQYLLKPISGLELMKCMRNVRSIILKEQEEKLNLARYKKEMKEYEEDEKRRLFHDIINHKESLVNILERGKELNLELSAMTYNIVLFKVSENRKVDGAPNHLSEVMQKLDTIFEEQEQVIRFNLLFDEMALLIKGNSVEEVKKIRDHYIHKIKELLESYEDIRYFGGIGNPVNRLGELKRSFQEASRAFAYRYIWDINKIIEYHQIALEQISSIPSSGLNAINVVQLDRRKVETFLKSGSKEDIHYFVEEYLNCIGKDNQNSILFLQYIAMDMYYITAGFSEELGFGAEAIATPFQSDSQLGMQVATFALTKKYIVKIFYQVMGLRDEIATKQYSDIIHKAKKYINENFTKEDISLNQVASEVYLSPSHFSAVFSQKTGHTFIKYLTDLRMNKAKELLKITDMKTSEIAYTVGYKDPHYFSYLFKKTQHCTPSQYRSSNQWREVREG
ncbi:MAG: response regulator [Clostridiales bacterium]|jgi:two-component system response regulator YesN|nr:response regulator [Clostridiales bacterium]